MLWGFRLAFYPAAVAIAAILLIGRGDAAARSGPLTGTTSQDASITLGVDGDGEPVGLETRLYAACPNGYRYWTPWRPYDSERVRFRSDGPRVWALEMIELHYENGNAGRGHYRLDAWLEDDRIEGVVEVVEHVDVAEGDDYTCTSGPVGFTAQR